MQFKVIRVKVHNFCHSYIGAPTVWAGMLDIDVIFVNRPRLTVYLAFNAGSSRQGNALLASVGWNWVTAMYLKKTEDIRW